MLHEIQKRCAEVSVGHKMFAHKEVTSHCCPGPSCQAVAAVEARGQGPGPAAAADLLCCSSNS